MTAAVTTYYTAASSGGTTDAGQLTYTGATAMLTAGSCLRTPPEELWEVSASSDCTWWTVPRVCEIALAAKDYGSEITSTFNFHSEK